MKLVVQRLCAEGKNTIDIGFPMGGEEQSTLVDGDRRLLVLTYDDPLEALEDAGRFLEMALAAVQADARRAVAA